MSFRVVYIGGLIACSLLGAAITPGTFGGDAAKALSTFLGLAASSIFPSVSLILATMTTGSRSVLALRRLKEELRRAVNDLFSILLGCGVVFLSIVLLSIPLPDFLGTLPHYGLRIIARTEQVLVVSGSFHIIMKAFYVPSVLLRSLDIRYEMAIDEAEKKTRENAEKLPKAAQAFPRDRKFGRTVKLSDLPKSHP